MHHTLAIQQAHTRISSYIFTTPVEKCQSLSTRYQQDVYFKCEHLQRTGSFKLRGALNKLLSLSPDKTKNGIIAASTGNHGLAVAYAAHTLDLRASIYAPSDASKAKLRAIASYGANIHLVQGGCLHAEKTARQTANQTDRVFISPYNDWDVIAGQGTIGLELIEQIPDLDAVFVSVGGGGLIGGIGHYLKQHAPNTRVVACWPEHAPIMHEHLKNGYISNVTERPTLSDATTGGLEPDTITFPLCQRVCDDRILVSETEIKQAIAFMAHQHHTIIEGAAAVALAAFLQQQKKYKGMRVAIVLCGKNVAIDNFMECIA